MTNPNEDLTGALYRVVRAIATLKSTEGVLCRQAYSELVAATCQAKKVLHEHGLPCRNKRLGHGTVATQEYSDARVSWTNRLPGERGVRGSLADALEGHRQQSALQIDRSHHDPFVLSPTKNLFNNCSESGRCTGIHCGLFIRHGRTLKHCRPRVKYIIKMCTLC